MREKKCCLAVSACLAAGLVIALFHVLTTTTTVCWRWPEQGLCLTSFLTGGQTFSDAEVAFGKGALRFSILIDEHEICIGSPVNENDLWSQGFVRKGNGSVLAFEGGFIEINRGRVHIHNGLRRHRVSICFDGGVVIEIPSEWSDIREVLGEPHLVSKHLGIYH